jgi:hypothetical protein
VDLINRYDSEKPFFVYMAYQNAHTPFFDTNYSTGIPLSYVAADVVTQIYNQSEVRSACCYIANILMLLYFRAPECENTA